MVGGSDVYKAGWARLVMPVGIRFDQRGVEVRFLRSACADMSAELPPIICAWAPPHHQPPVQRYH